MDDDIAAPDFRGTFWQDGFPSDILLGRFYVDEKRRSKLELYGSPDPMQRMLDAGQIRILGRLENGKPITLENCFFTRQSHTFGGDATGTVHVNLALLGHHFEQGRPISFRGIRFHSDVVDEWLSTDPIRIERARGTPKMTIRFDPPATRSWTLADGSVVSFDLEWGVSGMPARRRFDLRMRTFVSLLFKDERPLDELSTSMTMFNTLVAAATDQPVVADAVLAFTPPAETGGEPHSGTQADIYAQPSVVAEASMSSVHPPFGLFKFDLVADRFASLLENWFELYRLHEAPIGLFFSTRSGRDLFLANRFLMLMQALEGFHRRAFRTQSFSDQDYNELRGLLNEAVPSRFKDWLRPRLDYGNEPSLRQRLRELFGGLEMVFGSKEAIRRYIGELVDARNLLTHYEPTKTMPEGRNLHRLSVVAEMVFLVHLITLLGFPLTEAVNLYTSSQMFGRRAYYLRD